MKSSSHIPKKKTGRLRLWMAAALLPLLATMIYFSGCGDEKPKDQAQPPSIQKVYANHSADAEYLGKEACKSCHAEKYETFVQSEMGRSLKPAKLSQSVAKWEGIRPIYDLHSDLYYLPFHRGEDLFVREFRLKGKDTVHNRVEQLAYIVGSGQHTNSHMIEENGYVYQAPLTWYAQDGKWDLPPGFEAGHNTRFSRSIELECMTCHNAMPEFEPGSENRFVKVPDGIDCERCHGPGSIHVKEKQRGGQEHLIDGIDYSIVHPGKLPIERQFDICQRCHLQGTAVPADGKTFSDFRPGMVLSDYINTFIPRAKDSLNHFIMASHPDRLRMSNCFVGSQNNPKFPKAMTCITCHNPHLSIEKFEASHYQEACQGCHQPDSEDFCKAAPALRQSKQDNCAACHMPKSGSSDIPHVRITDHYIRVPEPDKKPLLSPEEAAAQKDFVRLACRTQSNPSASLMAQGYLTQYEQFEAKPWLLDSAEQAVRQAIQQQGEASQLPTLVRLRYLQLDYQALANLSAQYPAKQLQDAWTAYRLAEALQQIGDLQAALPYFEQASQLAPGHLRFKNKLASAYIKLQKLPEAMELLNELAGRFGKDASILNNRGFAFVLQENMQAAEQDFRRALALDPDFELAMANLASLYLNTGRIPLAKPLIARLIAINPENPGYLRLKDAAGS